MNRVTQHINGGNRDVVGAAPRTAKILAVEWFVSSVRACYSTGRFNAALYATFKDLAGNQVPARVRASPHGVAGMKSLVKSEVRR
jgi:hypothetical protein